MKYKFFILLSIFFVFTYPFTLPISLNEAIGWSTRIGRPLKTFFIPVWFLIIYCEYVYLKKRDVQLPPYFEWSHIIFSILPPFIFCDPFEKYIFYYSAKDPLQLLTNYETLSEIIKIYFCIQVIYFAVLSFKIGRSLLK